PTILRSKSSSVATGTLTWAQCAVAPDVPGDIRAGVVPKNITFTRKWVAKPLSWLNPIITTPTTVNATAVTGSGSLAAGTYQYSVIALNTGCYGGAGGGVGGGGLCF